MIFEVAETGELFEITDPDFLPSDESVYIFISTYDKRCYLWFGEKSGVRKQFIAANEGRKIKMDTAFSTCNVQHEGEEDAFDEAFEQWKNDLRNEIAPSPVAVEQRQRIQEMNYDSEAPFTTPTSSTPKKKKSVDKPKPRPKPKQQEEIQIETKDVPEDSVIEQIIEKLATLDPVENHIRDYIVTAGYIYATTVSEGKVEVELLEKVKDGVFEVDNYKNRYFLEDSNLIAIEMWRRPK